MVFIVEHRQYAAETIRIMIVAVALVPWCRIDAKIEITTGMREITTGMRLRLPQGYPTGFL